MEVLVISHRGMVASFYFSSPSLASYPLFPHSLRWAVWVSLGSLRGSDRDQFEPGSILQVRLTSTRASIGSAGWLGHFGLVLTKAWPEIWAPTIAPQASFLLSVSRGERRLAILLCPCGASEVATLSRQPPDVPSSPSFALLLGFHNPSKEDASHSSRPIRTVSFESPLLLLRLWMKCLSFLLNQHLLSMSTATIGHCPSSL